MPDSTLVRQIPPISCIDAVRALPEDERDKILQKGLDRKVVETLAGAVSQLSGRGDSSGQYGEYLSAVLTWIETLQQELKRLAEMQSFLLLHQRRWIELQALLTATDLDLSQPVRFRTPIGNINRQTRSATPTAPYTTPVMRFDSRHAVLKAQKHLHAEIVLVRDRFGAECLTRIGLNRWMLRKLYQEAGLEEQESARRRVEDQMSGEKRPGVADLVNACRSTGSAEKLLDLLFLALEHPSSWIPDTRGRPDQAFTLELDGNFERLLNPFFEKIRNKPSRFLERAGSAVNKGYQGATVINKTWAILKALLGLGAIYSAILALGSEAWTRSAEIVRSYTTPDEVLAYEAQFTREQARKTLIADKTIVAVAESENREDAAKSFAEVLADYVRENAGDRISLLFSRYLKHFQETGRNDWLPESADDQKRMAQVADLVALLNVQLFNEGPFLGTNGRPQRFLSSAVVERWPWRYETEGNLESVMRGVRDRNQTTSFPLPAGHLPPSFKSPPPPNNRSKWSVASEKIWQRHLSHGLRGLWENRPIRWGLLLGGATTVFLLVRRNLRRREQFRLIAIDSPDLST